MNKASRICFATTLAAGVFPAIALAQAPAPVAAQNGVEEIIVTAQRREENLQKIPVAVSAVTAEGLQNANIQSALELGKLVPTLQLTSESGTVTSFLRGVGSSITSVGNEASVATYIDGVYYSRLFPILFRLNGIERVEVLKGPQGTLFGRNASGGLVQIITRMPKPGQEFTLESQAGYSNYDTVDASLYAAGGIGDAIGWDISAIVHNQADGWGKNLTTGQDQYTDNSKAVRGKLIFALSPDTRLRLTAEYAKYRSDIGVPQGGFRQRQNGSYGTTLSGLLPFLDPYDSVNNSQANADGSQYVVSGRFEHEFEFATLVNTLAYKKQKQNYQIDIDQTATEFLTARLPSRTEELTNELQLLSASGGTLDWSTGLFYIDQKQSYVPANFTGPAVTGPLSTAFGIPVSSYNNYSSTGVRSISAYAQARYEIVQDLKLTLGGRYSVDKLRGNGFQSVTLVAGPDITIPGTTFADRRTYKKFTYKAALDYQFTPDVLGYASISRGYKGATYNTIPFTADPPAKPEVLDAYEIGFKSELFGRVLRLNGSAFWYDIKNPQVIITPVSATALTSNAGAAKVKGLELEALFSPTRRFTLRAAGTYLGEAKYTDYINATIINPNPLPPFGNLPAVSGNARGNRLVRSPKFTATVGADYRVPLADGSEIGFSTNLAYTSRIFFEPDNRAIQPARALLDAQISYTLPNDKVKITVFGSNLTDKLYYTSENSIGSPTGDIGVPGAPRTYGFSVRYKY